MVCPTERFAKRDECNTKQTITKYLLCQSVCSKFLNWCKWCVLTSKICCACGIYKYFRQNIIKSKQSYVTLHRTFFIKRIRDMIVVWYCLLEPYSIWPIFTSWKMFEDILHAPIHGGGAQDYQPCIHEVPVSFS